MSLSDHSNLLRLLLYYLVPLALPNLHEKLIQLNAKAYLHAMGSHQWCILYLQEVGSCCQFRSFKYFEAALYLPFLALPGIAHTAEHLVISLLHGEHSVVVYGKMALYVSVYMIF